MSWTQIKGYAWLPLLVAISIGFKIDMAGATIGAKIQTLPVENDLLQFRAGSHIMGFKPDKVYLANTAGFLSVEFLGAHTVAPKAATANADQSKKDATLTPPATPLTPGSANTLADLQQVEYPGLWDGITLRYDAAQDGLAESTYFIQPGADVANIRLRYNTDTELQADGSLKIKLPTQQGYITESRPVAWQMLDGKKQPVQVAYAIKDGTIGFKTGVYNREHELIIDPTYQWHTFYGSTSNHDYGNAIAVDSSGNLYITGVGGDTWGNPKHAHSSGFNDDIVVMKLDPSGTLVWNTFYGSTSEDAARGISVDGSGNIYVTGNSKATWGSPKHAHSSGANYDIAILKLDNTGTFAWNTFYGSASNDSGDAIAVDTGGNVYITGQSYASWVSPSSPLHSFSGNVDIVVMKLDSSGALNWHTFYGSSSYDQGKGIAVDASNNVYITGASDATWGTPKHSHSGSIEIMVMKLTSSGTLVWHTFYGAATYDYGNAIAVDSSSNVYITGASDATWGSPKHAHSGNSDIMVMKLNSSGDLVWHTFYGSSFYEEGKGIAVDGNNNVYITGTSQYGWGNPQHPFNTYADILIMKLTNSGALAWNTFYGSVAYDEGSAITVVNGNTDIYVTGQSSTTWDSPLHDHSTGGSNADIMVLKLVDKFPWPMYLPAITKGKP